MALVFAVAVGSTAVSSARAEADGFDGWSGQDKKYPSAEEACRSWWVWAGMNQTYSRFIGAFPYGDAGPETKACGWTSIQYLCPQEIGNYTLACGTVLPSVVFFSCDSGYDPTPDGRCIPNNPPQRPTSCTDPAVGNPIKVGSGAKLLAATDFATADGRFRIGRNYNSFQGGRTLNQRSLPLGSAIGWQFDFEMELQLGSFSGSPSSPTGNVTLITPDGSGYDFVLQANGSWEPRAASGAVSRDYRLEFVGSLPSDLSTIRNASSEWRVVGPDDRSWTLKTFSDVNANPASYRVGRPTNIHHRDGYSQEFNYAVDGSLSSITDTFGRTATFAWSKFYISTLPNIAGSLPFPETIKEITFPDGTKVAYTYDPPASVSAPSTSRVQRLAKVEWKDSGGAVVDSATYHYENADFPTFLTGITDHRGVRTATYAYDSTGRAVSTEGANGANKFTIVYGTSGSQVTRNVTNALGRTDVYKFDKVGGNSWDIRFAGVDGNATINCPASANAVTYDSNGYVASRTDEEGRVTTYVNDSRGRPTQITEAHGLPEARQTTITWHSSLNVPQQVVAPGLTVDYTYNTAGQLTVVTQTDTTSQTVPYSTNGQTRSWAYTYTVAGLLSSVDGPLPGTGDTVSYTYDAAGYLATVTDELGHVTTVDGVNGRGQPTAIVDANGLGSALSYDARGRLTARVDDPSGISARTEFAYDNAGNVTTLTKPDGSVLTMEYDGANRATSVTDGLGDKVTYIYDAVGNRTNEQFTDTNSQLFFEFNRTFDELGRLRQVIGVGPATWTYGYDKVGNPTSITDPNSHAATSAYDGLDRLISLADERNSTTTQGFGPTDDPTSVTDPRNVATTYVRNGWGEVIQESSPDIGTTVYVRNRNGQITQKTDAGGIVTIYTYDYAGRVTTRSYPSETASDVAYTYDGVAGGNPGKGRLTSVTDAAGTVSYTYDLLGRVTQEARTIGARTYTVGYSWDDADNLLSITYPSGRVVEYGRGSNGEVQQVRTSPNAVSSPTELVLWAAYTPFGPRYVTAFANDLRESREYDTDGRITGYGIEDQSLGQDLIRRSLQYQDKRNLTSIEDQLNAANNESYSYTANGFLENANGPWGSLTYTIDGVGNITQRTVTIGGVTSTDVHTLQPGSNRLTGIATDGTPSRSFQSDLAGNISEDAIVTPALTKAYSYNAAGQLAGATTNGAASGAYVYDHQSRLVSRTISASSTTLHMVHDLDGNVIAEYNASGALVTEYISVDGRPLAMVDNTGATPALYYVLTDHLERPIMMTDENRNIVWQASYLPYGEVRTVTGSATLNQRFPGQWFQVETGLSYNWHRHYDPTTGRYLQPDPLGMPDGPSRYAYVGNSPLMKVDPTGQFIPLPYGGWDALKSGLGNLWNWLFPPYCSFPTEPYIPPAGPLLEPAGPPVLNNDNGGESQAEPEQTPTTNPEKFRPVRGTSGKENPETGEIWEKDKLHKDHYEVYKNRKDYERGRRDRDVWLDGRPKRKF